MLLRRRYAVSFKSVKIDSELVDMAHAITRRRRSKIMVYFSELLRPVVELDYAEVIREMREELAREQLARSSRARKED
jgi:hypothetical protein